MSPPAGDGDSNEGLTIRHATQSDLDGINRISNHYIETSHVTFDLDSYSRDMRSEWLEKFSETGRHQLFVAIRDDELLGFAHSSPLRPKGAYETSVETTVYLDPGRIGIGVGSRLYRVLIDALRAEDVHRAYGGVALPNPESEALHKRFGFREIGTYEEVGRKFGRYWSVRWYELALD